MAPTEKMFSRRPDVVDSKSRQLRGLLDAAVVQLVPDGVAPLVVKRDWGSLRVEHGPIGQPVKDKIIAKDRCNESHFTTTSEGPKFDVVRIFLVEWKQLS